MHHYNYTIIFYNNLSQINAHHAILGILVYPYLPVDLWTIFLHITEKRKTYIVMLIWQGNGGKNGKTR